MTQSNVMVYLSCLLLRGSFLSRVRRAWYAFCALVVQSLYVAAVRSIEKDVGHANTVTVIVAIVQRNKKKKKKKPKTNRYDTRVYLYRKAEMRVVRKKKKKRKTSSDSTGLLLILISSTWYHIVQHPTYYVVQYPICFLITITTTRRNGQFLQTWNCH